MNYLLHHLLYIFQFTCLKLIVNQYNIIDLARANSGALDNIYSLLKQNIKSCNAKQQARSTPENGEKQQ